MKNEIILDVPFTEKDEAKMLGARWNPELKKWYLPKNVNSQPFKRWIKSEDSDREKSKKGI